MVHQEKFHPQAEQREWSFPPVQHWWGHTLCLILGCPIGTSEPFLLWRWLSIARKCPRSLWHLHPWRYSEAVSIWPWETGYWWLSWSKAFEPDHLQRSLPTSIPLWVYELKFSGVIRVHTSAVLLLKYLKVFLFVYFYILPFNIILYHYIFLKWKLIPKE